jgi:hypothetical protein
VEVGAGEEVGGGSVTVGGLLVGAGSGAPKRFGDGRQAEKKNKKLKTKSRKRLYGLRIIRASG